MPKNLDDKPSQPPEQHSGSATDSIYSQRRTAVGAFRFDEQVARVFPDMIKRSVPGYEMILEMISIISTKFTQADSNCYDLGCSLGASTLAIANGLQHADCRVIAVDNSLPMIERCEELRPQWPLSAQQTRAIEFRHADIRQVQITNASLVTLNFTLQFLPDTDKQKLINDIAKGMRVGGALVLSEKLQSPEAETQHCLTDLHHAFKLNRGYSELEVAQKRSALENVLLPETFETHKIRLQEAGFSQVHLWFQCFNFVSLLAIK